jgi:hypothetical protein
MPAILNMLLPLLPYLAGALGLIFVYFKIKGKGKDEANQKWEKPKRKPQLNKLRKC